MKVLMTATSLDASYGGPAFSVSQLATALGEAGAVVGLWSADGSAAIAIVAWAQAAHGRGCGGLTQGPLLAPLKGWIEETERRLAAGG